MTTLLEADPVLRLVEAQRAACEFLRSAEQISFATDVERELSKVFVLSAASYFESRITSAILTMAAGPGDPRVAMLVRTKAVKRQYHSYFDWDGEKIGPFRTMFGDDVADAFKREAKENSEYVTAEKAFMVIGHQRNLIVHGNFATYALPGDLDEWVARYRVATRFVDFIETLLRVSGARQVEAGSIEPPSPPELSADHG